MDRRDFLKSVLMGGVVSTLTTDSLMQVLAQAPVDTFAPDQVQNSTVHYTVSRLTYGMTPELFGTLSEDNLSAFIEEQLSPELIDDSALDAQLQEFPVIDMSARELYARYRANREPMLLEFYGALILRAMTSRRQLYERMVEFWGDHFSVYIRKGATSYLKIVDDRQAIRPHAMGKFRDLLFASTSSPSILFYLDNAQSFKGEVPNENFARELMELHTMGVNGGYTEADVVDVARAFKGWSIDLEESEYGTFQFRGRGHDVGAKSILGQEFRINGGMNEGERVLAILASHPSTARHISTKLIRRFVADDPPQSLIDRTTQTFLDTDGDIRSVLRTIFLSDEFWQAPPKFKRPFDYLIGILRALDYQVADHDYFSSILVPSLESMGQLPFDWHAPDGYPDTQSHWLGNLLERWNLALKAVRGTQDAQPNFEAISSLSDSVTSPHSLSQYLFGRSLTEAEQNIVADFMNEVSSDAGQQALAATALLMASPAYQYR